MPDLFKLLPDRVVRVPLSYLLSAAICLVTISVAYGGWKNSSQTTVNDVLETKQEIVELRKDMVSLRIEMEALRVSLTDLRDVVGPKRQ